MDCLYVTVFEILETIFCNQLANCKRTDVFLYFGQKILSYIISHNQLIVRSSMP